MERKYVALALIGLIGCAALVSAGVIGVELADGYGMPGAGSGTNDAANGADAEAPDSGAWLRDRMRDRMQDRMQQHRHQMQHRQVERADLAMEHYLNLTRLEGILAYDSEMETYMIDATVLYVGDDRFLASLARSDYDRDGSYEQVQDELQGLVGGEVVVNGLLDNDTLHVSHVNGIWLRVPREVTVMELEGVLENSNGSFFVDGTELCFAGPGRPRSDIDGDGILERLHEELDGLVGDMVTVDGAMAHGRLVVMHVNGISVR